MNSEDKYIIRFDNSKENHGESYYLHGKFNDGYYYIDSAWISKREEATVFNSKEEAQKIIDESKTIVPELWLIELL